MEDADKAEFRALLQEAEPDDIPISVYSLEALELARAMFVVLSREKGPTFAEQVRDELGRRANELAECGHPWEEQVGKALLDMQFSDIWGDVGISGDYRDDDPAR